MSVEFVGIELQLRGEEGVKSDLQELDRLLRSLGGRKAVKLETSRLKRDILAGEREVEKLNEELREAKANLEALGDSASDLDRNKVSRITAELDNTKNKLKENKQALQEVNLATRTVGQSFMQNFKQASTAVTHLGGRMQSLGTALSKLSMPFNRLMSGTVFSAGYKLLGLMSSGLSGATQRSDIMATYRPIMTALAGDVKDVNKLNTQLEDSLGRLNDAVLGLPTGLDEIVDMHKQLTIATQDMAKAEQLAIASNNAYLAGGADEAIVTQGKRMLQTLATTGELTAKQWNSLRKAIPVTWNEMQAEIDENLTELSAEDFMNLLIEKGIKGKTADVVGEMLHTYNAATANIENAFKRMGQNVLKTLDEVLTRFTGKDTIDTLISFKDAIDSFSKGVQSWIKANPDVIIGLLDTIKGIDWKGFFLGVGDGLKALSRTAQRLGGILGGRGMRFIGNFMVKAGLWGKQLSVIGGILKGLSYPLALFYALSKNIPEGGLFGRLFGGFGGSGGAGGIGGMAKASGSLVKLAKNIGLIAASVAGIGAIGVVSLGSIRIAIEELKKTVDITRSFSPEDVKVATDVIMVAVGFFSGVALLSNSIGKVGFAGAKDVLIGEAIIGAITTLASLILAVDMALVESAFSSFKGITESLKKGMNNLSELSSISVNTSGIDNAISAFNKLQGALKGENYQGDGGGGLTSTKRDAKNYEKIVISLSNIVSTLKGTLSELDSLPEVKDLDGAKQKIEDAVSALKEINDFAIEMFADVRVALTDSSRNETIATNISSLISTIVGSYADFTALEKITTKLDKAKENIKKVGEKMAEIYTEFEGLFSTYSMEYDAFSGMGGGTQTATKGISQNNVDNASKLGQIFQAFSQTIGYIRSAYEQIVGGEGSQAFSVDKFKSVMEGLTGEEGIVAQMKEMYTNLSEGFGDSEVDIATPLAGFSDAVVRIKEVATTLSEIESIKFTGKEGVGGVIESIKSMVSDLSNVFNADAIAVVVEQINSFVSSVGSLLAQIQSMQGMSADNALALAITIDPTITGDEEAVKLLNDAHDKIEKARDAVKKLEETITLSFPISATVSGVDSAVAELNTAASRLRTARDNLRSVSGSGNVSVTASTGGYINNRGKVLYRSRGGDIFKPRGTDTVPAMLTPGEYVHRRKAVDFFGIDFMRKINNLDVRGAMAELMTMAGHMANTGSQTIINNTYNNNQKVVQNVNTNSPDFAFKSASRFAGAF